jgi:hypothetical protein
VTQQLEWSITDYRGVMLNHLEVLFKPGEVELATLFMSALGFEAVDYGRVTSAGKPYLFIHLEPSDKDTVNNIFYLSEARPEQLELEAALRSARESRPDLARAWDAYVHKALNKPHGIPHAGIRFQSFEALEAVLERLNTAAESELKGRVAVKAIAPGDPGSMSDRLLQAFVYTDVVASGLFGLGQVFELQGQKKVPA